jgi:hypothetical protein
MAYYIFLKSLRSLEEFRKNPHVKIPPKSPFTNFQSLGKFKNAIFNSEILFSLFSVRPTLQPTRPLAQPARCPRKPKPPLLAHLARASVTSSWEIHFPFWFTPSKLAASPSPLCQLGPGRQLHPPPPAARAHPRRHRSPATERRPAPRLGCHRTVTTSPSFSLP